MRHSAIFLILFCVLLSLGTPTMACGGRFPTSIEYAATFDAFVGAEVVAVDDVGINAILKVDRYLRGSGAEYIVIMRHPPALQHAGAKRSDTTSDACTPVTTPPFWRNRQLRLFSACPRNSDGTYRDHVKCGDQRALHSRRRIRRFLQRRSRKIRRICRLAR